jgi:hypothetical protein
MVSNEDTVGSIKTTKEFKILSARNSFIFNANNVKFKQVFPELVVLDPPIIHPTESTESVLVKSSRMSLSLDQVWKSLVRITLCLCVLIVFAILSHLYKLVKLN